MKATGCAIALVVVSCLASAVAAAQDTPEAPAVEVSPAPAATPPAAPSAPPAQPYPPQPAQSYPPPPYTPGYPPPAHGSPPPSYAPGYPPYGYPPGYGYVPPPDPGHERHDGFYLRMMFGGGYRKASASSGTDEATIYGTGPGLTLAIGGALVDNVVLFGQLTVASALEPQLRSSTQGTTGTTTLNNTDTDLFGIGVGLAYYVMPVNVYIAGALLMSQLQLSENGNSGNSADVTDEGLGVDLTVGKEWWVSSNWGLGIAAQLFFARLPDVGTGTNGEQVHWNTVATTLAFSATFN